MERTYKKAQEFKLLRYSPAEILKMKNKLYKLNLQIDTKLLEMAAVALCGFFQCDYPVITAVYTRDKEIFNKYCCCTMKKNFNDTDPVWVAKVNRLWDLLITTLLPVLELVRNTLPVTTESQLMFRGVSFKTLHDLKRFII